jgi:Na+-driven multidrug efflux pump
MIVNLSRQCLILFTVITLMNYFFKLNGLLLAQPIADLATAAFAVIHGPSGNDEVTALARRGTIDPEVKTGY